MRGPWDELFHLARAAEVRTLMNEGHQEYGDEDYYFHLEQAKAWRRLIEEVEGAIQTLRTSVGEDALQTNDRAFRLHHRLIGYCLGFDDKERANRWYGEIRAFGPYTDVERMAARWDFSTPPKNTPGYELKIRVMEQEFLAKGEIPLYHRQRFAERMVSLGGLARDFGDEFVAKQCYTRAARILEPYTYNVWEAYPGVLHDLYLRLRWGEHLRQFFLWMLTKASAFSEGIQALCLGRLGMLSSFRGEVEKARTFVEEAGHALHARAKKQDGRNMVVSLARAAVLYGRAAATESLENVAPPAIEGLEELYTGNEAGGWSYWGECLRRVYVASGRSREAASLAEGLIQRYRLESSDHDALGEAYFRSWDPNVFRLEPYLGLAFCHESLGEWDSAIRDLCRAEDRFHSLLGSRESLSDGNRPLWETCIRWCRSLVLGLRCRKREATSEEAVFAFLEMAEFGGEGMGSGWLSWIAEDGVWQLHRMLIEAGIRPFVPEDVPLYFELDEEPFLSTLRRSRLKREGRRDMERELSEFARSSRREGLPEKVVRRLVELARERGYDVTVWPREALSGFQMLVEREIPFATVLPPNASEQSVVITLVGIGRGAVPI